MPKPILKALIKVKDTKTIISLPVVDTLHAQICLSSSYDIKEHKMNYLKGENQRQLSLRNDQNALF